MKKRLFIIISLCVLCIPAVLFGGWKFIEWRALSHLKGSGFEVQPYEKNITETHYDVIVVGGEPEGVAAAVAAARNGSKTLLIEHRDGLGGLMTYGKLNFIDYDYDVNGDIANAGIFKEWHKLVGGHVAFDIETAKDAFLYLVQQESNLTLSLNTKLEDVIMSEDGSLLEGIIVQDENGQMTYTAERFIDTTQDADLAYLANVPYFIGGADIGLEGRKMAVTLMVHLENVRWESIAYAIATNKFGHAKMNSVAAWGFVDLHYLYQPKEPGTRLRGLNIARQSDRSVYINALHIFDVDGLDPESIAEGIERGKRETENVIQYLREEFPGFSNAKIVSFPEELYIRETRHILAEYQLPITDIWENRDHWDRIGFGSYPIDIQATSIHDYGYIVTDPVQYAIPFRSLVPLEVDGLLVASKAAGYSSLAAGSTRIIPTGMTAAEAAGVAASISIEHDVSFRQLSQNEELITKLQTYLEEQEALVYPFSIEYAYEGAWFYPAVQTLLNYGLISGGHHNDLRVEQTMSELEFVNLLTNGLQRVNREAYLEREQGLRDIYFMAQKDRTSITRDQFARFVLTVLGQSREGDAWQNVVDQELVDFFIEEQFPENREIIRKEGYYLLAHILEKLKNNELPYDR